MARELAASAETLFTEGKYSEALLVFEELQATGCSMCPLRRYKAQCYLELKDLPSALRELDTGLSELSTQDDPHRRKTIYKELAVLKTDILKREPASAEYRKALEDVKVNTYSRKLREWAGGTIKELDSVEWPDAQQKLLSHEEYKEFSTHFQKEAKEGDLWHLISTQWTRRWLSHLQGGEPPGPISNASIIEFPSSNFRPDPDKSKSYTNVRVKHGLIENEDFQVIPKSAYHLLVTKYGHDNSEIRRYSVATNTEGTLTMVEIWLKRVQVLIGAKVREVSISRKEIVADLKEKLIRSFEIVSPTRLWKKKTAEVLKNAIELMRKADSLDQSLVFPCCSLLEETKDLENADIADDDILILETYSESHKWLLLPEHAETCNSCGRTGKLLVCTGCRTAKYCSANCQRNHYSRHKEVCKRKQKKGRLGLVGLQNLGNTCFMNSAIQCLSHTVPLTNYLLEDKHKTELNKKNPIGTGGKLVTAYVTLLQDLWLENEPLQSPWELKRTISTFAPQFSGYQQHDSHELLSFLLDGIHEDLNRVLKKPYTTLSEEPGRTDEELASEFWSNHLKRNQSIVVDLMHGQYKSTLHCPQCNKVSVTFDPFLTCTLQIPNRDSKKCSFVFIALDTAQNPKELECCLSLTTSMAEVKAMIIEEFRVEKSTVITIAFDHKRFKGVVGDDMELSNLKQFQIVFYECPSKSLHPICVNITEKTEEDKIRPALWPRVLFFTKDATAESIHRAVTQLGVVLLKSLSEHSSIRIVNRAKVKTSYFMFQSRAPCVFCGDKECFNCEFPTSPNLPLTTLLKKADNQLELEIRCERFVNRETSDLRVHQSARQTTNQKQHISLVDCLQYSSRAEVLSKENAWFCSTCKEDVQATKTLQLYKSPEILIMHLKRFRPRFYEKLNSMVEFPLEGLDLNDFVIQPSSTPQIYDLYAVSNHYGSVLGGHYTAFIHTSGRWYDMDDSSIREVRNLAEILTPAAYMLFYRRRSKP